MKSSLRSLIILITAIFMLTCGFNVMAKPANTKNLIKEAAAAYENDDFDTAIAKFNEAYQADPSKSSILYNMGRVYESKADYVTANDYYKQFLMAEGSDEDFRVDAIERIKKNNETLEILGTPAPKGTTKSAPKASTAGKKAASAAVGVAASAPAGGCIDINTASSSELQNLKGIGEKKAEAIIASRNSQGAYKSADDLTRIKGIGPAIVDKLRPQVCPIGGGTAAPAPAPVAKKTAEKPAAKASKSTKQAAGAADNIFDI